MTSPTRIGAADDFGGADAARLARWSDGPCVSIFLPTHRSGPQTRQDPIRLGNLLDEALRQLVATGMEGGAAEDLLAPHRAMLDDEEVWRHLSDGLALFAAPGLSERYRVPGSLPEEVATGPVFRLRPLLPLLAADGRWSLLAIAQNDVRLYAATATTITELDRGPIPASMAEALAHEDPERQLQFRAGGGPAAQFHGHGAGDEVDKQALERFLRAVDHGVAEVLGGEPHPLVLACVGYYAPMYRSITRHPRVVDGCVEGSPEDRNPAELHAEGWPLAAQQLAAPRDEARDRLGSAPGDRIATDAHAVLAAAGEGRVDAVFVAATEPGWGDENADPEAGTTTPLDRAVAGTLAAGGAAYAVDAPVLPDQPVVALLRY